MYWTNTKDVVSVATYWISGIEAGFSRIGFGVFAENKSAIRFYLRQGTEFVKTNEYELGGKKYPTDYYFLATKLESGA